MQWESCTNSSVERFFKRFLIMQREGHRNPEMDQEPPGRMPDFGDTRGRNILYGMQCCGPVGQNVQRRLVYANRGAEAECRSFLLTSAELSDKAKLLCKGVRERLHGS